MKGSIIIAGSLAQRPGYGGMAWVFLQYVLGFRKLGWDVLFLDWLTPAMCRDHEGKMCAVEESRNLAWIRDVMQEHGLANCWSLDFNDGERTFGRTRVEVIETADRAALLINVMGFLTDRKILDRVGKRVFLDIDPGFGQMWQELGLAKIFDGHDAWLTVGENIGSADCTIPLCGLEWIATPQPVVLDHWPVCDADAAAPFTSIVSWRGPFGPVEYAGKTYGLRVHEFRKFVALPQRTGQRFDLALDIDASEANDLALLRENHWHLLDPRTTVVTPWNYREFIQRSKAELMIAKNMYVATNGGWVSDRSICYLASGKPVLAQDTGFTRHYPTGEGFLAFTTPDEAQAGVEEINRDYDRHCRAARAIAEQHFDSDKVLTRLLGKLL